MSQSNIFQNTVPVMLNKTPQEGPKAAPVFYDFSAGIQSYDTDLTIVKQQGKISMIQSIFIDNATGNNLQPVIVTISGTEQKIAIPAGYQGIFPVLVTDKAKFNVATAGAGQVSVYYCNVAQYPSLWQSSAIPITIGGTLTVTDPILDACVANNRLNVTTYVAANTLTDRSGTIAAGGVSQQAAAANAARQGWSLQNIDAAENLYVNLGAAAVVDGAGSFLLGPYASIQLVGSAAINVIAATIGHKYTLKEW